MYEILIVDDSVLDIDCILFLIDKYNFLWSNFGKIGHFLQPL